MTTPVAPPYAPVAPTNTKAILSLVFAFLFWPVSIVLGHMAHKEIKRTGEAGRELATVGLVLSYIGMAGFILFVTIMAAAGAAAVESDSSAPYGQVAAPLNAQAAPALAASENNVAPKVSDFAVSVKILEKACFGSAGCHVVYQVQPTYSGSPASLTRDYTVVYEVDGGEYGSQVNNFTVGDVGFRVEEQEMTSTSASSATLTARVVSISAS